MKRKLLTILLSLTMIMISMTNVVFADGEEPVAQIVDGSSYTTVQNAVDAATDGQTIRLIVDCNENVSIPQDKTVTIDLNGNVLSAPTTGGSVIIVKGNLTLADSNTESQHAGYVDENGLWHLGEIPQGANNCTEKNTTGGIITGGKGFFKSNEYLGGGVYVEENGTFVMNGGTIVGCSATKGGGVFTLGDFTMSNSSAIVNCTVTVDGGGVYVYSGAFSMNKGTISNNTANTSGGGVYVWTPGNFTMSGGTISKNEAKSTNAAYAGGGVCTCGEFILNSGTISENKANTVGGGVDIAGGKFTMNNGTITSNHANKGGGGVYADGEFNMSDGTIACNDTNNKINDWGEGGGVLVNNGKTFNMSGGYIVENTATNGGGVNSKGTFNMSSGVIENNSAKPNLEDNLTYWGGGGVIIYGNGNATLSGGKIQYNSSTVRGGGLLILQNGTTPKDVLLTGVSITNNTATTGGGGVFFDNQYVTLKLGGNTSIKDNVLNGTITKNDSGYSLTGGTKNNLQFGRGVNSEITMEQDLLKSMNIGLFGNNIKIKKAVSGDENYFFADDENYKVSLNNNNTIDDTNDDYLEIRQITIADILPDDFPNSAEKGWVNKDGAKVYKDDALNIIHLDCSKNLNSTLSKVGNDYKLETNYTFIMTSGVLSSIKIEGALEIPPAKPNGEYSPYKYIEVPTPVTAGNTSNLVFKTNAYYNGTPSTVKVYIKLQGQSKELLDDDYYTLEQGSTKVTLKGSYVSTLPVGTHTITIEVNEYVPISQDFTIVAKPAPTLTPKPNKKPKYKAPSTGVDDIYFNY